mgnify:CR=1 FL=1
MSQEFQERQQDEDEQVVDDVTAQEQPSTDDAGFDSLLDEIDGVLEANAEELVRSFVQKGGQ